MSKEHAGEPRYTVDLGKDPVFARRKLAEMRTEQFFSRSTRRAVISMTVYNNALPMFCFLRLVFDISLTGEVVSFFVVEGMTVQEYMGDAWWFQVLLELLVAVWTGWQVADKMREAREEIADKGWCAGLLSHLSNAWAVLDWMRFLAFIIAFSLWISLVSDSSRDIDLDTSQFVDLEDTAVAFRTYNLLYNVIIIVALFSMLQYTDLDDRMALLTRSVYQSLSDLLPFMLLFLIFVLIFGTIGHLLYGPVLLEWSGFGKALVTATDIIVGNYQFVALEAGLDQEEQINYVVAAIYFYVYFFLMMLIVLNIVIAILMDGYAGVKETVKSTVEEQIKYNVGPLIPDVMARWRASLVALVPGQRRNSAQGERERWTDERWARDLTTITDRRSKLGLTRYNIRVGQLVSELNVLSTSAGEDVAWQVQVAFQDRSFITPSNIRDPFQEPCVSPVALACPKACSARRVASLPAVRTSTLHYQVHAARSRTIKPLGLTMPRLTKLLLRLRPALGDESRVRTVAARRRIRWPKCKRRCASRKHACASS